MGILKKIVKYVAPLVALTYLSLTPLHSFSPKNIQSLSNPKPLYTLIQKEQEHNVQRGESLWGIAKQYLPKNATNTEIKKKVKNIQYFSGLKSTKENDNQKYVNGKKCSGQDGLIDIIKPGQELIIDNIYEAKLNRAINETTSTYTKSVKNYNLLYALAIPATFFAVYVLKRKQRLIDPPELNKRFSIKKVRDSGLENKLNKLLRKGKSYSDISKFIENKAYMPISRSTYYRYRKIV